MTRSAAARSAGTRQVMLQARGRSCCRSGQVMLQERAGRAAGMRLVVMEARAAHAADGGTASAGLQQVLLQHDQTGGRFCELCHILQFSP